MVTDGGMKRAERVPGWPVEAPATPPRVDGYYWAARGGPNVAGWVEKSESPRDNSRGQSPQKAHQDSRFRSERTT